MKITLYVPLPRGFLPLLLLSLAFFSLGKAEERAELTEAARPLDEGVPEVAVVRLRAFLAGKISNEERQRATESLGEALVASGNFAEALQVLGASDTRDSLAKKFFQAQAYAGMSHWHQALPLYQMCASDPGSPFRADALFGQAEAFRALGKPHEALQTLEPLRSDERWQRRAELRSIELLVGMGDSAGATRLLNAFQPVSAAERNERRFLRGRNEMARGRNNRAIDLFASILKKPEGTTHSVLVATLSAIAEAHRQNGTSTSGDDFLEDFIEHQPRDPDLPAIFAKLDQLYSEEKPARHELGRWSREPTEPRRALARWYLARAELRLGHRDLARQTFAGLRAEHPALPALAEAFLESAQLELRDGRFEEAAAILETARKLRPAPAVAERINLLAGKNLYEAKRFSEAAEIFHKVAQSSSAHTQDALVDTSLAWLQAGEEGRAATVNQELNQRGSEETRGDLLLEQGLAQAGRGENKAVDTLHSFLRDFPKHPRTSEAWVALAEFAFRNAPPRLDEATQNLARAAENAPAPGATERADYLRIWIEEAGSPPNEEKVITLANEFLRQHETSSLASEVRLKLAETYYRRQDFASARTQFELLAQKDTASPMAEKAEFFAAQSASQSMGAASLAQALSLFDAVVKRNGELKWAARNEQAVIERKLGKSEDAMTLYDEVLKGDGPAAEKREALCGKGDILYELGVNDKENYRRAMELYGQLAAQSDAAAHWRNQALFKKGMCLEKLEAPAEALSTFYEIIENQSRAERRQEFFWFYKAGFNAARLLEEEEKWQPAAAIYEKLAFAGGARSDEAKARLNRIRLEHFLWDQ